MNESAPATVTGPGAWHEGIGFMQDAPYRELPLRDHEGEARAFVRVDATDYDALAVYNWHLAANGYAARSQRFGPGVKRMIYMHRVILGLAHGDSRAVDHINRDGLDNRRSNLRIVTDAQNKQNLAPRAGCTSRFRGVALIRTSGMWRAYASLDGKRQHLGCFETEEAAARAARAFRAKNMPFANEDGGGVAP